MQRATTMQHAFSTAAEQSRKKALTGRPDALESRVRTLKTVHQVEAALNRRRFNLKAAS